jgi:hypothetical protein
VPEGQERHQRSGEDERSSFFLSFFCEVFVLGTFFVLRLITEVENLGGDLFKAGEKQRACRCQEKKKEKKRKKEKKKKKKKKKKKGKNKKKATNPFLLVEKNESFAPCFTDCCPPCGNCGRSA